MVMTTGFLRVCAPSVLLLLTTTTLVQQADGTTATSNVAVACDTELEACRVAETCTSCINDLDEEKAEVNVCGEALGFYDVQTTSAVESDAETCEEIHAVACCLEEVTVDEQCLEDDAFVSYWLCISETNGCIQDGIDCSEIVDELAAEEDSGATAAASVGIIASTTAAFAGVTCASIVLQLL